MNLFNEDIEQIAIERIKTFCPPEGYYVAFSGGKDSIVVLDLVKRSGVKYDAHMNLTSVDPPELLKFVKIHYPDVERHKPEKTMFQLIPEKRMPPTRVVRYCCEVLKERGGSWRTVITGIRAQESFKRKHRKLVEFCIKDSHKKYVHPIIDWFHEDVWGYIRKYNLPYPSLYDEGLKRIGCVCCPMSSKVAREAERWPNVKKAYISSFKKMIEWRVRDGLPTQWTTGQEVWDWWTKENKKPDPNQQCFVFD